MNINEIAKLAGVSRATVSRYLNDGYVSEEKRAAIARVITETGYVPSAQASALRSGRTRFVGVIIPKVNSESVGRILSGISEVLNREGYYAYLANSENSEEAELRYLRALDARQVDGVIFIASAVSDEHREAIDDLGVPVVVLGQRAPGLTCVYFDDYHALYDLTQGICGTCQHPAHLGVTLRDVAVGQERYRGFVDAMLAEGIAFDDMVIERGAFSNESGREMAEKVLEEHPEVDAMVCATDAIAAGAYAALRDAGRRVPEDVQVTGLGDGAVGRVLYPTLTTAHYFYRTSGREAASLLVEAMTTKHPAPREVRMGYRLILRGSTRNE